MSLKLLLKDSGFSLVQGLVLAGVLAASALVATRMITDQKMALKGVESRDQIENLHSMIFATLQNKDHCTATLWPYLNPTAGGLNPRVQAVNTIKVRNATFTPEDIFAVNGAYLNNTLIIDSMNLRLANPINGPQDFEITYSRLEGASGNKRTKVGYGGKKIKKTIKILLQRDPATGSGHPMTGCYAVEEGTPGGVGNVDLIKNFCTRNPFFTWDANFNVCMPLNNICPPPEIFVGFTQGGQRICRPLSHQVNMNTLLGQLVDTSVDPSCTGVPTDLTDVRFVAVNGKARIACNTSASYSCPGKHQTWAANGYVCEASLPTRNNGLTANATDNSGPVRGGASFSCNNGIWQVVPGSATCAPASTGTCTIQRRRWNTKCGIGDSGLALGALTVPSPHQNHCLSLCGCQPSDMRTEHYSCRWTP